MKPPEGRGRDSLSRGTLGSWVSERVLDDVGDSIVDEQVNLGGTSRVEIAINICNLTNRAEKDVEV